eukprot:1999491-Rhodomonas_salina.1
MGQADECDDEGDVRRSSALAGTKFAVTRAQLFRFQISRMVFRVTWYLSACVWLAWLNAAPPARVKFCGRWAKIASTDCCVRFPRIGMMTGE